MNFFKNRTVIGLLCIVLSLVICFAITPMFNRTISEKTEIVRVTKNIRIGDEITKDMVKPVEVGAYNLPESVVRNIDEVIGKYASADMAPGDYIIRSKVAEEPAAENAYLYNLNGEKQAISVSVKAFANGLSGKLVSGDIVSVIAPDYRKQGSTVIPPELQYVEVIAVTANSGYDANTGERGDEETEKELPGTVTLWLHRSRERSWRNWKQMGSCIYLWYTGEQRKMPGSLWKPRKSCWKNYIHQREKKRKGTRRGKAKQQEQKQ